VGCNFGRFLKRARDAGWRGRGFEPNTEAAEATRQLGFEVASGWQLAEAGFSPAQFQAIVLVDVFYYSWHPFQDLQTYCRLLRPGGMLVVETWDIGSPLAKVMKSKWQQITPPSVVWLWDRQQLEAMVERAGFHGISVKASMKWVSLRTVLGQLGKGNLAKHPVGRLAIPYAFGDLVILTARA